jgi:hypothetical protein
MNIPCCHFNNCKKTCYPKIKSLNLCINHINLIYYYKILYIQKIYKGYYCRNKLKNLFYNLPCDIQKIIIYYINEPIYYKNIIKTYNKIIIKKSLNLSHNIINSKKISLDNISHLYYLTTKYYSVLNINFLKYLYVISNDLCDILNYYMFNIIPGYTINNILLNNINLHDINHDIYCKILNNIYIYQNIYTINSMKTYSM